MTITKCNGKDCPLKNSCRRFTDKTNKIYQSWVQWEFKTWKCDLLFKK